jgi:hypothetical protein
MIPQQVLAQKIKTARQEALCANGYSNLDSLYSVNRKIEKELKDEMILIEGAEDIFKNPDKYILKQNET